MTRVEGETVDYGISSAIGSPDILLFQAYGDAQSVDSFVALLLEVSTSAYLEINHLPSVQRHSSR